VSPTLSFSALHLLSSWHDTRLTYFIYDSRGEKSATLTFASVGIQSLVGFLCEVPYETVANSDIITIEFSYAMHGCRDYLKIKELVYLQKIDF
jgi:hypothetical protein